jgi:hypothetical protein
MLRLFEKLGCMRSHRDGLDMLEIDVELPVGESAEALTTTLRSVAAGSSAVAAV